MRVRVRAREQRVRRVRRRARPLSARRRLHGRLHAARLHHAAQDDTGEGARREALVGAAGVHGEPHGEPAAAARVGGRRGECGSLPHRPLQAG